MTTSELIKQLQGLDPEGNMIVDGVYFCEKLPYYYDGKSYDINRNESTNNKLKIIIGNKKDKIRINIFSLDDFCDFYNYNKEEILNNIDISNLNESEKNEYLLIIDKYVLDNNKT